MDIQALLAKLMGGGASPSGMPWSDQQNIPPPMPGAPTAAPAAPAPESPDPQAGGAPGPAPLPGATPPTPTAAMPTPLPPGKAQAPSLAGGIQKLSPFNAQHTPMDAVRGYMAKLLAGG